MTIFAHQLQAVDMQVDRAGTDGTAAGQGDVCCTEAGLPAGPGPGWARMVFTSS